MIVIPAIDLQGGKCVRLSQGRLGTTTVYSENPVEVSRHWVGQGAERLHVVDLDGAFTGEPKNLALIREIVHTAGIPVQVGGGIGTLELAKELVESGVSRIILGSKVVQDPNFIKKACVLFPGKVVVSIDARAGRVMVRGWTQSTDQSAIELAQRVVDLGVPTIIYTDVERDGMLSGPNLAELSALARAVKVSVIASGGVSRIADIQSLLSLESDGVSGVIIGKALYTGALKLPEALDLVKSKNNVE
jgi:phosphoribosylformimino-5-aminoimidazole carboxamide ribotide isomerase